MKRPPWPSLFASLGHLTRSARTARDGTIARAAVQFEPATIDEEARTVQATVATEAALIDFDWRTCRSIVGVLLADGMVRTERVPLTDSHGIWTVSSSLGSVRDLAAHGSEVRATVHFSRRQAALDAFGDVADGHLTDFSIRAQGLKITHIDPGKSKTVRGKTYTAPDDMPMRIFTRWKPIEVGLCVVGADPASVARQAQAEELAMQFEQWLTKRGFQPDAITDAQRESLHGLYEAELARSGGAPADPPADPSDPPANTPAAGPTRSAAGPDGAATDPPAVLSLETVRAEAQRSAREAIEAERAAEATRQQAIRDLAGDAVPADVVNGLIARGASEAEAATEIVRHMRESRPSVAGPAIHTGGVELSRHHVAAGIAMRENAEHDAIVRAFGEEVANQADEACRHLTAMDVCRMALTLERQEIPHDREEMIRAAFTTGNLTKIFTDSAHLFVMQGYMSTPATWRAWTKRLRASDFKAHTGVRLGTDSRLKKVSGATGEVGQGSFVEEGESYRIFTLAELIAITRQHIIDDSLGLLNETGTMIGQAAMEQIGDEAYTALLANGTMTDSKALFHADHGNLGSMLLTDENLSTAKKTYRNQTNMAGRRINRAPEFCMIPPELERTLLKLINSENVVAMGGGNNTTEGEKNVHYKTLKPIIEGRLSDTSFHASATATSWYLTSGPSTGGVGVAFLNGKDTPTITRFAPGPDYVAGGVILQVFIDVGAAPMEYRSIQRNDAPA